jgi:hypothetical protein
MIGRENLARVVVLGSFLAIFLMVAALVGLAQGPNSAASTAAEKAFNIILPVLAGWVGTVLAFYFSAASQERASQSLDNAVNQVGGGSGSGKRVSEVMIPFTQILGTEEIGDGKSILAMTLVMLKEKFNSKVGNVKITRLIFHQNGVFRYIFHESIVNAFLVSTVSDVNRLKEGTLADLLADPDITKQVSTLVAFVPAYATLAEARNALDRVSGAQDIIVTTSGQAGTPILGWLSNVDLIKAMPEK